MIASICGCLSQTPFLPPHLTYLRSFLGPTFRTKKLGGSKSIYCFNQSLANTMSGSKGLLAPHGHCSGQLGRQNSLFTYPPMGKRSAGLYACVFLDPLYCYWLQSDCKWSRLEGGWNAVGLDHITHVWQATCCGSAKIINTLWIIDSGIDQYGSGPPVLNLTCPHVYNNEEEHTKDQAGLDLTSCRFFNGCIIFQTGIIQEWVGYLLQV